MRFIALIGFVLTACGGQPTASEPSPVEIVAKVQAGTRSDIDVQQLAALDPTKVTLIDVRTPAEYAAGHVPGTVLIPMDTVDPSAAPFADHPKDEPLYFICQSGGRSGRVADQLAKAGFTTVNVEGGTGGWQAAGLPIEQ